MAEAEETGEKSREKRSSADDLYLIAWWQKAIVCCILGAVVCRLGLPLLPPPVNVLFAVAAFGVAVVASVFVFQLAMHLYGRATGIVLGVLTLIPVLGIITLLVLNAKATSTLRQHGVKVGLLGADLSEL